MSDQAKRIDLRLGELAVAVSGYADPVPVAAALLDALAERARTAPGLATAGLAIEAETLAALKAEVATRLGAGETALTLVPGLVATAAGRSAAADPAIGAPAGMAEPGEVFNLFADVGSDTPPAPDAAPLPMGDRAAEGSPEGDLPPPLSDPAAVEAAAMPAPPVPRWIEDPNEPAWDMADAPLSDPAPGSTARPPAEPAVQTVSAPVVPGGHHAALIARYRPDGSGEDAALPATAPVLPRSSGHAPSAEAMARRTGATGLPALIEVAAAWLSLSARQARYTRYEVMEVLVRLPGGAAAPAQRTGAFRELVDAGTLVAVGDGQFALSQEVLDRYAPLTS